MNMIRIFILFVAIGAQVFPGFAGNDKEEIITIQGTVLDESGEPLAGVAIRVQGLPSAIYTDLDGNFTISIPKSGKLNATVSTISYKEKQIELDAQKGAKNEPLKISLE